MVFGLSSSKPQAAHRRSSAIGDQFTTIGEEEKNRGLRARRSRSQSSADFQVCCVAAFQSCLAYNLTRHADLEIGDTAGFGNPRYSALARLQITSESSA